MQITTSLHFFKLIDTMPLQISNKSLTEAK
jgi:hypothetical protein